MEIAVPALKRARKHKAPTRGHVADILGMKTVTPRSIAYIAVQVHHYSSHESSIGCFLTSLAIAAIRLVKRQCVE